eukprot:TRINITY_DN1963_c1_g1_i8.p1 TRINITY_DN1963_c1_g1~~TRINITY_DN1963_c1_g1_i8.p1  ORF type:complete len:630 (+),score=129.04 TRINITY_DN1963_c1_g1_i8:31-1890(+)
MIAPPLPMQAKSSKLVHGFHGDLVDSLDLETGNNSNNATAVQQRPRSLLPVVRHRRALPGMYRAPQPARFAHRPQGGAAVQAPAQTMTAPKRQVSFNPQVHQKLISPAKGHGDTEGDNDAAAGTGDRPSTADILKPRPSRMRLQASQARDTRVPSAQAPQQQQQAGGSDAQAALAVVDDDMGDLSKSTKLFLCAEELARKSGVTPTQILAALYKSQTTPRVHTDLTKQVRGQGDDPELGLVPAHVREGRRKALGKGKAQVERPRVKGAVNAPQARGGGGALAANPARSAVTQATQRAKEKKEQEAARLRALAAQEEEQEARARLAQAEAAAAAAAAEQESEAVVPDSHDAASDTPTSQGSAKGVKKVRRKRINPHDKRLQKDPSPVKSGYASRHTPETREDSGGHVTGGGGHGYARTDVQAGPDPILGKSLSLSLSLSLLVCPHSQQLAHSAFSSLYHTDILEGHAPADETEGDIPGDSDPLSLTVLSLEQHRLEQSIARLDSELERNQVTGRTHAGPVPGGGGGSSALGDCIQDAELSDDELVNLYCDDASSVFSLSTLTATNASYVGSAAGRYLPMGALQPKRRQPNRRHTLIKRVSSPKRAEHAARKETGSLLVHE